MAGSCDQGIEYLSFYKSRNIYWPSGEVVAAEGGLRSMKLVTFCHLFLAPKMLLIFYQFILKCGAYYKGFRENGNHNDV